MYPIGAAEIVAYGFRMEIQIHLAISTQRFHLLDWLMGTKLLLIHLSPYEGAREVQ